MDWTQMLFEVLAFIIKTGTIVMAIAIVILLAAWLGAMKSSQPQFKIDNWTDRFEDIKAQLEAHILTKDELKKRKKQEKAKQKENEGKKKPHLFVLSFDGDIKASATESLKSEITAVLSAAQKGDEVLLVLESPGGVVHGYGLAAAELMRLRNHGLNLTVSIDQIGASGGYMMACVAHKIVASPFAIVGSIGVVSQVPNFHRVLKKHDVDFKEYTAGEYKRTVSILGEITPEKERKFEIQLQETHELFKKHILQFRPQLDLKKVATGEYWYGLQAQELGLVDEINTSQEILLAKAETHKILSLRFEKKKSLQEKVMGVASQWLQGKFAITNSHPWDQIQ